VPSNAFREAIANAIVHRNYDINAAVKVSLFDDKIEIVSPGGLPDSLTREDYVSGRYCTIKPFSLQRLLFR